MAEPARQPSSPLSVSQLTHYLKYLLERDEFLNALSVQGEISEYSRSPAGHIYFNLKDARSQVSCVLFQREAARQSIDLASLRKGIAVVVHGYVSVYEPRGTYQITVRQIRVQGDGTFAQRFEQLKARLEREGLFEPARKRSLPKYPRVLALITAPDRQAYHDVLHRLGHQYPFVKVIVAPVTVQGENSPVEIAMALDIVNRLTPAELILLVRGGGAREDLIAFDDERVARAIFASRIPVVTGIGHETDQTIADFVADVRAATPSLAAASAVPDVESLVRQSVQLHKNATHLVRERLRSCHRRLEETQRALLRTKPETRLNMQRQRADELRRTAGRTMDMALRNKKARLSSLRAQLAALDPLSILARGYAVLSDAETGRVVSRVDEAKPGQRLQAQVADGTFVTRVEQP